MYHTVREFLVDQLVEESRVSAEKARRITSQISNLEIVVCNSMEILKIYIKCRVTVIFELALSATKWMYLHASPRSTFWWMKKSKRISIF